MRDINPEEVKLATLKYKDNPETRERYYVHIEFVEPIKLSQDEKPIKELYTLCHRTPEAAEQNFMNLFKNSSESEKVQKRTLIDACGFVL
ncbi:MAG: hypothetical protein WC584_02690 [Candidatus Pacearchaeota archaeon]